MAWSLWVCNTITGAKIQKLPLPAEFSWSRVLNGSGEGAATIQLNDETVKKLDIKSLTAPVTNTLVLEWDGVVVYAGVIWSRTYDRRWGTLALRHADIWSVLDKRFAVDHFVAFVPWVSNYANVSLRQIVKYMMWLGLNGPAGSNMMLNISLPADETGTINRTIYGYHLTNLVDALEDLMNEAGGPDIDFRPRWVANALNWEMRVGSTAAPKLTDGSYEWRFGAEVPGIFDLTVTDDAEKMVTNMVTIGEGSEQDMLSWNVREDNPAYPLLERMIPYKTESDITRLGELTLGGLNAYKVPTTQWGFNVKASGTPAVSSLLPGGTAKVWVQNDPWLPTGWATHRLVQFSGDLSETVALAFQPHGGV